MKRFRKLMTELQMFKADHGGKLARVTMGHPGSKLVYKIRYFCKQKDTTKEQLAALTVNALQAPEASAERLTREENKWPKRRRQL